ncbi:MAG: MBL fold metallo-hydrolase [Candidatus Kapabacteria bacterium]|nr:MBL fold metallo-hydrolase [Candidatus Kapabacteria bacterium]
MMRFTLLGTGTSTGVPSVGCLCATCTSTNPRDKRLRPSLLVQSPTTTVVIDTSSDFRQQMLTHRVLDIDALVFTHHHFDHIGGFDDIRPYNFHNNKDMPVYALERTFTALRSTFPYAFEEPEQLGGGVPQVVITVIDSEPFTIGDIEFIPIPMMHGKLRVNGYRIGSFAYCTDTNFIPDESFVLLEGVDTLVLDCLRYHEHETHFTVEQAVAAATRIGARQTYFTHIAHQIQHDKLNAELPDHIRVGYDGLLIETES